MENETNQGGSSTPHAVFATLAGWPPTAGTRREPVPVAAIGGLARRGWLMAFRPSALYFQWRRPHEVRMARSQAERRPEFLLKSSPNTGVGAARRPSLGLECKPHFRIGGNLMTPDPPWALSDAKGGGKIANMLLPVCGGMGFTMLWMVIGSLLRAVAR